MHATRISLAVATLVAFAAYHTIQTVGALPASTGALVHARDLFVPRNSSGEPAHCSDSPCDTCAGGKLECGDCKHCQSPPAIRALDASIGADILMVN
ncbi:hypothetical protein BDZ90DRAFT_279659 [Jaminaea rosea]|uniref:Uncharacterized protein n=1 Tax=Jaminaea rosea TaxID=1569628 RepID=A0A316UW01_9BASI|nr:hypothetical protein BDZ90DRAFT_279659 [Jaminaea rosea]PWN27295.1 hypothetical protein BDZ90DRAFT_279659 [Jaminaea rosea]